MAFCKYCGADSDVATLTCCPKSRDNLARDLAWDRLRQDQVIFSMMNDSYCEEENEEENDESL